MTCFFGCEAFFVFNVLGRSNYILLERVAICVNPLCSPITFHFNNSTKSSRKLFVLELPISKTRRIYLADCVGVFAAEPFFPSSVFKCCSRASSNELGAFVRSGISPLSMPMFWRNENLIKFKNDLAGSTYLCDLQELSDTVHSRQELFVQVERIAALLLVHVEVFLQQVYDGIVVASEQSDQVAEQQHEAHIDDTCGVNQIINNVK